MQEKIKELKKDLEQLVAEERMLRSNIQELKSLVEQKKVKAESLKLLKEEEAKLLAELES
jgi:septal ring factor EnvC (AmiA/AmiB activator)